MAPAPQVVATASAQLNITKVNLTSEIDRFIADFRNIVPANSWTGNSFDKERTFNLFLVAAGDAARPKLRKIQWAAGEAKLYDNIKIKLLALFTPQNSEVTAAYIFKSMVLGQDQPFELYQEHLKAIIRNCNYGHKANIKCHLCDQIIFGHYDKAFRGDLSLLHTYKDVVKKCRGLQSRQGSLLLVGSLPAAADTLHPCSIAFRSLPVLLWSHRRCSRPLPV